MKITVDYYVEWPGAIDQEGKEEITPPAGFSDWDGEDQERWMFDTMYHRFSDGMPDEASGLWLDWRLVA